RPASTSCRWTRRPAPRGRRETVQAPSAPRPCRWAGAARSAPHCGCRSPTARRCWNADRSLRRVSWSPPVVAGSSQPRARPSGRYRQRDGPSVGSIPQRQEATMTLYAAIDLHSNNGVLSVIDSHNAVRFEQRLPNDMDAVRTALEPFRDDLSALAVESTYNWYWLV